MCVHHVLNRIGDEFARRQAVEHAAVTHRDAVVDSDRVELLGHTAIFLDFPSDQLSKIFQVYVPGYELGERVRNRDDRLFEIVVLHTGRPPEGASTRHVASVGGGS